MWASSRVFLTVLALFYVFLSFAGAQSRDECTSDAARRSWVDQSSPVYTEATEFARMLSARGIVVKCIRRSKEERLFKGEKGAAWFKTDKGVFEIWFVPKTESFDRLEIIEKKQGNGRYLYSFRGAPQNTRFGQPEADVFY